MTRRAWHECAEEAQKAGLPVQIELAPCGEEKDPVLIGMWWPWQDNKHISVRIGSFSPGADEHAASDLDTRIKDWLEIGDELAVLFDLCDQLVRDADIKQVAADKRRSPARAPKALQAPAWASQNDLPSRQPER